MRHDSYYTTKRALYQIFGTIAGVFLVLGALAAPVRGGTIMGTFDGMTTLTPTGTPGVFIQNLTGDGADSHFGTFAATDQSTIDFSNPPNIELSGGNLTELFGDGSLFGTSSGGGTANGNGTAAFTADFIVTGGTGVFLGYTGEVTITGTITQTGPTTEDISATYRGFVSTPEPATPILLGAGALALGWLRRKSLR